MRVTSDRRYHFSVEPDTVWSALLAVTTYRSWWPCLIEFDGQLLAAGETWNCSLRSPLRTVLRLQLRIDLIVERERIDASLSGDLDGFASVTLSECSNGSAVRLESTLRPRSRTVGLMATVAPPLARWAHDRLIDTAAQQFRPSLSAI